jgi:glucokinase
MDSRTPHDAPRTLRAGIDLGGTKIQAVVVDARSSVLGSARRATPTSGGPNDVVAALAETLREAASTAKVGLGQLAHVGVGTPGSVDAERGTVANARNLPGFEGAVPMVAMLEREIGAHVFLGNDVGVALDAEAQLGAGRDVESFVGAWWGTGVGGGVVLRGQRWLGRGAAGEIGHTIVVRGGAKCPCGRRGCLEAYAGRRAMELRARKFAARGHETVLFDLMKKKGLDRLTSGVWAKALAKRDRMATKLVDRAVSALAAALASAVNLLDVEAVVIGGGLGTRLGDPYVARIAERMQPHLFRPSAAPPVRLAALGDLAGAIGAGLLGERALRGRAD